jgi:hypothetical protein
VGHFTTARAILSAYCDNVHGNHPGSA